jgi:hypothetical protein
MARPRIGIFGALAILGGVLAWKWTQRQRAAQGHLTRDLNRWEDEGGAVVSTAQNTAGAAGTPESSVGAQHAAQTNGAAHPNGMGEAWPFPHSSQPS